MYLVLQGDVLLVVLGLGLGQALLVLVLIQILHVVLLKLFLTPAEITNEANKLALLWGEAQLCLPYVCLEKEK